MKEALDITELKNKTAIATKWSTLAEISAKFITPFINIILARLLTPIDFGIVATVNMIVSFADVFTDAGFQKYIMQHTFESEKDLDNQTNVAFWTNLTISTFLWVIIVIFSEQIATLVGNPGLSLVIIISSISLPLTSFSSIHMARFKKIFDFKSLMLIRLVSALLPLFVTVPIAFFTHSYWALVVGTLASNAANAFLLTIKSNWKVKIYYNLSTLKKMITYSWWILLESISLWLTTYIGTFIVGKFLSQYYVGLYKTSITTVNQIMGLITASTSSPLFMALSNMKNNQKELINIYSEYIGAISMFVLPMGVGIFAFKSLTVSILLGNQWVEATNFVGLWGLIYAFSIVYGTYCNSFYNAIGKTYLSFISQILQLSLLIPVLIWSSQTNFNTLYISRSLVRIELIISQILMMKLLFNFSVKKQISPTIPSLISSGIMYIIAYLWIIIFKDLVMHIVGVIVCIICYFAVYYFLFKEYLFRYIKILGIKKVKNER